MDATDCNSSEGGWTVVTRRRRPQHFTPSPLPPPTQTVALSPLALTYAQVLQEKPQSTQPPKATKPTHNYAAPTQRHVRPPLRPTELRYPPNPHFKEWWGRCFRCAKKGHVVAECKHPRATPNLAEQHIQPTLAAGPSQLTPPHNAHLAPKRPRPEPTFEEFLGEPEPHYEPQMPSNRPRRMRCYFNRDQQYYQTLQKMLRGIVVKPPNKSKTYLTLDQIAAAVAASTLVASSQLQVARLSHHRFLVLLPPHLAKEDVVAGIPSEIWDQGFTFHSYSPLADTSITIPLFKIWIDIKGVPLELQHETHIARAVGSFGLYLGSMDPAIPGDCSTWSVFVATDDLCLVPLEIEFRVGGMAYTSVVCPRKWIRGPVYQRHDLPPAPISYDPPPQPTAALVRADGQTSHPTSDPSGSSPPSPGTDWFDDPDVFPMSLKALREVFRDFDPANLPADLATCLAGDREAIRANQNAHRNWESRREENRIRTYFTQTPPAVATVDPTTTTVPPQQPLPAASQRPMTSAAITSPAPRPPTQSLALELPLQNNQPTVHRTDPRAPPKPQMPLDLAPQLCSERPFPIVPKHVQTWEAHTLFPEIAAPITPHTSYTTPEDASPHDAPNPPPPTLPKPIRTTRISKDKNPHGTASLPDLDAQQFYDIPLEYAEGREILSLIGAAAIPIPSHLMAPQKSQPLCLMDLGQPSKPNTRKNKRAGPSTIKTTRPTSSPATSSQGQARAASSQGQARAAPSQGPAHIPQPHNETAQASHAVPTADASNPSGADTPLQRVDCSVKE